jgi:hypothetical protein
VIAVQAEPIAELLQPGLEIKHELMEEASMLAA